MWSYKWKLRTMMTKYGTGKVRVIRGTEFLVTNLACQER